MIDTKNTERIYYNAWINSQLSVARFSGGCIINNTKYVVCNLTNDLVREDIYKKEFNYSKWVAAEKKKWEAAKHRGIFDGLD